ncbi:hypothetical protein CLAIMM_08555 [Cladophialophora immunda]|nr:hypothetical protein CLAIMM_08555 [Cladophialophora immunda]
MELGHGASTAFKEVEKDYMLVAVLGLLGTLLFVVLLRLYSALSSPLRGLPGPWSTPFSRLWFLREVWYGTFHITDIKLHEKLGAIIRIAPNQYSLDDPDAVQLIYGSKAGFTKSHWYTAGEVPGNPNPNIFSDLNNERHAFNRRKISSAYSMTSLLKLEPFINRCTAILQQRLDDFASHDLVVDVCHWMQCYAFDVIGEITLGKRFGFLDAGEDIGGIMQSLESSLFYTARVGVCNEWHPILFYLNAMLAPNMKGLVYTMNFIKQTVDARLKLSKGVLPPKDHNEAEDFITRFQRIAEEDPGKMTKDDIWMSCTANIGAGSDTTAVSLTAVVYFVFSHPGVLGRLRAELDDAAKRGELSGVITFKEAQKLPYLQAVLKESMRMHPAVGLPLGRLVPAGGATISGHYFPAGTTVGINPWVAHRNKAVFGPDADVFRPERWLEAPETVKKREAYFLTFGAGTRTCLGKNISILELSKVIPMIVQKYDFEPLVPGQPLTTENVWFVKPKNFNCRVRRRF